MQTATKVSKTQEMQDEIESLKTSLRDESALVDERENEIVALEAQNKRLLDKRSDVLTDDVVMDFIAKKSKEYDPDKVVRGERSGNGRVRQICHLFNQLKGAVEQYKKDSK